MKRLLRIVSVMMTAVMFLSGCTGDGNKESTVSEISAVTGESSAKEVQKPEQNSKSEKSKTESSKESSVQSSEESSEESSEKTGEVSEDESSEESSELSSEQSEDVSAESSVELSSEPERVLDKSDVYGFDKKYFVSKLDESMLNIFLKMYDAVQHFEMTAKFKEEVPSDDFDMLMFLLNYDCPELIQLNGDYSPIYADESEANVSGVYFTYNMGESDCEEYTNELHLFFEELKADTGDMSEIEKEKYV